MPEMFHEFAVAKSKVVRHCSWCGEPIDVGQPYRGYSYKESESATPEKIKMHPECYDAMDNAAKDEGGWMEWSFGDFSRGCDCERGHCDCNKGEQNEI